MILKFLSYYAISPLFYVSEILYGIQERMISHTTLDVQQQEVIPAGFESYVGEYI